MKKFFFSLIVCLLAISQIYAQRTVSGKVTDDVGEGLPGVNVVIKGTTTGATTDIDGNYRLEANDGDILVFSYVGFEAQEISIGSRSVVDVTLGGATELQEVVVVAYGTANKSSFTGSAATVGEDLIKDRPVSNVANVLAGTVSGLQATASSGQPGSSPDFQIRGVGTFSASSDPLFIVDGVQYDQNINNLNPSDIQSLTVLKDAASTALYGSRAANGVVVITTKKGSGAPKVNIRMSQGVVDQGIPQYDKMGTQAYYEQMWEGYRNELVSGGDDLATAGTLASQDLIGTKLGYNVYNVADGSLVSAEGVFNPSASLLYDDFDWFGAISRNGSRSDFGADISGSNGKTDYFVSLGYLKEEGYLIKAEFQRYSARMNMNTELNDWLKMGVNINGTYSQSVSNGTGAGSGAFANPFNFSRFMGPIYPIYQHDPTTGEFVLDGQGERQFDPGGVQAFRPNSPGRHNLQEQLLDKNNFERIVISKRSYLEASFLNDFKFRLNAGVDLYHLYDVEFRNTLVGDGAPAGRSERTSTNQISTTLNQLLTYSKTFGDHFVDVLVGHESYRFVDKEFNAQRGGQIAFGNTELANFATLNAGTGEIDEESLESFFFRGNYEYQGKYIASISYRRDGSSRLAPDNRWDDFKAFGIGWRLSEESFMSSVSWMNELKLRASWGETGNVNGIGFYPYQGLYTILPNAGEAGFIPGNPANPALGWETQVQSDVAIDFVAFDSRLSGTIEYFDRTSEALLFDVPLAPSLGTPEGSITRNIGSFKNSGIEIQLAGDVIRNSDFRWNLDVNASFIKNEIQSLPDGEEIDNGTKRLREGGNFYAYYLRDYAGVDENTGDPLYRGVLSYNATTDIIVGSDTLTTSANNAREDYIGKNSSPDVFGGITNTISYKGFSLRAIISYQIGGYLFDGTYQRLMNPDYGDAAHADLANAWTTPGQVTDVPRYDPTNQANTNVSSDRWLISRTHMNLQQVTLSYQFSQSILDQLKIRSANAYISGENLALISGRKGLNYNRAFSGTSSNTFLPSRIYTIGLNIGI